LSSLDKTSRGSKIRCNWFFDKNINASFDQLATDIAVRSRRDGDNYGVRMCCQVFQAGESIAGVIDGCSRGPSGIDVCNAGQLYLIDIPENS
jgi:hypothetical protein